MFVGTIGIEARASLALGKSVSSSVRLIMAWGNGRGWQQIKEMQAGTKSSRALNTMTR